MVDNDAKHKQNLDFTRCVRCLLRVLRVCHVVAVAACKFIIVKTGLISSCQ